MNTPSPGARPIVGGLLLATACLLFAATSAAHARPGDKLTFELYKDKAGEFRWRLQAANGKILAVPEDAYKSRADAKRAVETIQGNVAKMKVEYVTDKGGEHRWRLKAANGRVMARASEGYKSKEGAEKAFATVKEGVKEAAVADEK